MPSASDEASTRAEVTSGSSGLPGIGTYRGPSVGAAKGFAVLAFNAITAVANSAVTGNLGVSGAPVSSITGFDAVPAIKYGTDSGAPYTMRTILTQREVEALVDDIDVRPCDAHYASLSNGVTLRPGVTCLTASEPSASGTVTLDAQGDPDAFFVIQSESALNVADFSKLTLINGAQACGVFWQVSGQATIGKGVELSGTLIAGKGIDVGAGSTLVGRALARTADVRLDGAQLTLPLYGLSGNPGNCSHVQ